jgi:hypothetical protein
MALYRLRRPSLDRQTTYLDGSYPWFIPFLKCSDCGLETGYEGVTYPSVDLSSLTNVADYAADKRLIAQPPERIAELIANVRSIIPDNLWIPPRTGFGRFCGQIDGLPKNYSTLHGLIPVRS